MYGQPATEILRHQSEASGNVTVRQGFTFCICPDSTLLRQQLDSLLDGQARDATWERHVFWGDEELSRQFWDHLTLQGLFSTLRMLVIRNAQNLPVETWKKLSSALARPNPQVWPVLCLEMAWEKGQPKLPSSIARQACFVFAGKKGWIWRQAGLDGPSLRRHVQIRARTMGLDFESDSFDRLCEMLPSEASAVESELAKLALLVCDENGEKRAVRTADLRELGNLSDFNIFTLLRQIQSGQSAAVWKTVLTEEARGEEPLFYLLAMLQRETRQLWQLLANEQVYVPPRDLGSKKQTAARLGAGGLAALWDIMHVAELDVKSGRSSPGQALNSLIAKLGRLFC